MRMLIVGATGGTGRAVLAELLGRGHQVTAYSRQTRQLGEDAGAARLVDGDATDATAIAAAVAGQDAVIVTLGITESPLGVRLRGPRHTTPDVRSVGTRRVIEAMQQHNVPRLVVQSSYGVGESRDCLRLADRIVFSLLLRPQIQDTERQETLVRASGLDWTIVQPVHLGDGPQLRRLHLSTDRDVDGMRVTRRGVATVLADSAETEQHIHRTIAVSTSTNTTSPKHPTKSR